MLSEEDNILLTRTGPTRRWATCSAASGTRSLLSAELPEPDGAPRARQRARRGPARLPQPPTARSAWSSPRCPHRGADLFFGRNEDGGIRCAYHGWKFATDGRCLAMPTMDPGPARETARNRTCGCWLIRCGKRAASSGPISARAEHMPALPELEFLTLPASHVFVSKKLQQCNWAQACEGGLDTAHFSFLHMPVSDAEDVTDRLMTKVSSDTDTVRWMRDDGAPRFTITGASRRARAGRRPPRRSRARTTGASASS